MKPAAANKTRDVVARELAQANAGVEASISKVVRIYGDHERRHSDPIKLLQVNSGTIAVGIVPIAFGRNEDVPFPFNIVDVTPAEFERILTGDLPLPKGWRLGETLFECKHS